MPRNIVSKRKSVQMALSTKITFPALKDKKRKAYRKSLCRMCQCASDGSWWKIPNRREATEMLKELDTPEVIQIHGF